MKPALQSFSSAAMGARSGRTLQARGKRVPVIQPVAGIESALPCVYRPCRTHLYCSMMETCCSERQQLQTERPRAEGAR